MIKVVFSSFNIHIKVDIKSKKINLHSSSTLSNKARTNNWPTFLAPDSLVNCVYPFQNDIRGNDALYSPDLLVDANVRKFSTCKSMNIKEVSNIYKYIIFNNFGTTLLFTACRISAVVAVCISFILAPWLISFNALSILLLPNTFLKNKGRNFFPVFIATYCLILICLGIQSMQKFHP